MHKAFRAIINFYRPGYLKVLASAFKRRKYNSSSYASWYLHTNDFEASKEKTGLTSTDRQLVGLLALADMIILFIAALFIYSEIKGESAGGIAFGLAAVLIAPLIVAALLPLLYFAVQLLNLFVNPKKIGKAMMCSLLEIQARRLRNKYDFKVIAVAGSMGKTSTKLAVAELLKSTGLRVRYQTGNYNDRLTVPLVLFNQPLPNLFNFAAWLKILSATEKRVQTKYLYDVVVLELGTDKPGQIKKFAYLKPDITVITGVAAEHMEYFKTLDAVAKEELSILEHSARVLVNTDDVAEEYLQHPMYIGYGLINKRIDYYAEGKKENLHGQEVEVFIRGQKLLSTHTAFLGAQGRKIILSAVAVADLLNIESKAISDAVKKLKPFAGRMQILKGIEKCTIIDDTYNATPAAMVAALEVLENTKAAQRIAVLGSMNELGDFSVEAHKTIGAMINPKKIDLVITIGSEARDYLAPAAQEKGCIVKSFLNPKEAGMYVENSVEEGAVILFKGSQNGVFAEEAIKPLLADPDDAAKLVRQSPYWMKHKRSILAK